MKSKKWTPEEIRTLWNYYTEFGKSSGIRAFCTLYPHRSQNACWIKLSRMKNNNFNELVEIVQVDKKSDNKEKQSWFVRFLKFVFGF